MHCVYFRLHALLLVFSFIDFPTNRSWTCSLNPARQRRQSSMGMLLFILFNDGFFLWCCTFVTAQTDRVFGTYVIWCYHVDGVGAKSTTDLFMFVCKRCGTRLAGLEPTSSLVGLAIRQTDVNNKSRRVTITHASYWNCAPCGVLTRSSQLSVGCAGLAYIFQVPLPRWYLLPPGNVTFRLRTCARFAGPSHVFPFTAWVSFNSSGSPPSAFNYRPLTSRCKNTHHVTSLIYPRAGGTWHEFCSNRSVFFGLSSTCSFVLPFCIFCRLDAGEGRLEESLSVVDMWSIKL